MVMEAIAAMPGMKFGADPELFIQNSLTGEFVSAGGIIPGTKESPHKVAYGAIQQDGVAAEYNIDPVETFEDWERNHKSVIKTLQNFLPKDHRLVGVPAVEFSRAAWDKVADYDKILGCSPDMNAWTGDVNSPPDMEGPLARTRCAGGHIHIGWTEDADPQDIDHLKNANELVQQLDYYLGGWSLQKDADPVRRNLYGKAGACRVKPYGVEYRVLSNFWLGSRALRLETWNRTNKAIWDMANVFRPDQAKVFGKSKGIDFNAMLIESINTSKRSAVLEQIFKFPIVKIAQA